MENNEFDVVKIMAAVSALTAAKQLALRPENEGKNIVVILADSGMKYLSTNMYK